ncbi:MAG: DUF6259 domain-containing protein [Planctomycetota bacterium]|nr:DUF6259 domain-containing protein [Planctomycetota bacterium]
MTDSNFANHLCSMIFILALANTGSASGRVWDFQRPNEDWQCESPGCGVIAEPGNTKNGVFRISATRAHHTRAYLQKGSEHPGFILFARFKVVEWEGAPPAVYLYGRSGREGFHALTSSASSGRLFSYYGQDEPSISHGNVRAGYATKSKWLRVALACYEDYVFAKSWPEGTPEPHWQAEGKSSRLKAGEVSFGVWTSPKTPSKATVLFDDIRFVSLTADSLEKWGIRPGPRPSLNVADLPERGVFRVPGRIGLASDPSAIAFDEKSGEITNFVDRASGREFISREAKEPLFRLAFTKPYSEEKLELSSRDFKRVEVKTPGPNAAELHFTECSGPSVRIVVKAILGEAGALRLRLSIGNPSDWCIASCIFPRMPAPPVLGDSDEDDRMLLPWSGGALVPSPGRRWNSRDMLYPGGAFAQFSALYDDDAGSYIALDDAEGHCKRFRLRSLPGRSVSLSIEHLFPEIPGRDFELPYGVILRTFKGDWRDAADIYRAWAVQQPWCAKKLSERKDIPQFLKEGAGIIITGIQHPQGRAKLLGENLEKLPGLLNAYRDATGLKHMVFVPYGWEKHGCWTGINYFPSVPDDALWRKGNANLKSIGHRTAFLTSGFWWVVKRQKTGSGPAFDDTADFERRSGMCITRADGSIWTVDWYDRTKQFGSWRGLSAKLCHGSEEARNTMREIFLKAAALGVPLISFDQEIGGGQKAPCYSKTHGHPPGYGHWMWTGFRDTCTGILKEGKTIQPELGLFIENLSELAIPYVATYWSRQFGEVDVGASGGRGVGLFSYLYHDYVTAIGAACVQGQGAQGTRPDALLRCRILANNLTRGLIPGPFLHEVPLKGGDKWRQLVSQAYRSVNRPYAHFSEYLLNGKLVRPIKIECKEIETFFWRNDARKGKPLRKGGRPVSKTLLALPAITTGSFQADDSTIAAFLVNTTPENQSAVAVLPPAKEIVVYRANRVEEGRVTGQDGETRFPLIFEPFGVRVLLMR